MAISQYSELKTAVANWLGRSDLTSRIPEFIGLAEDRVYQRLRLRAMETQAELKSSANVSVDTVSGTNTIALTPDTAATAYALGDAYTFDAAATNTSSVDVNVSALGAKDLKAREGNGTRELNANEIVSGFSYRIYYDGTQFLLAPQGGIPLPDRFIAERRIYLQATAKRLDFFPPQLFWTRNAVNDSGSPQIYTIEGDWLCVAPSGGGQLRMVYYRRPPDMSSDTDTNYILAYHKGLLLTASMLEAALYLQDDVTALKWAKTLEADIDAANWSDRKDRFPSGSLTSRSEVGVV